VSVFQNTLQEFVYLRTYARWRDDLGRRESWPETVDRVVDFFKQERPNIPQDVLADIREAVYTLQVLPSMRLVWAAGEAAKRCNVSIFNCSFVAIDSPLAFPEMLYILMQGTGAGFSVESKYIDQLPVIPKITNHDLCFSVPDSKEGWADSVKTQLEYLYSGASITMNYDALRPRGARLKIMGGRSSGPEPLIALHQFIDTTFKAAQGRKLTSLEAHDICCKIAEIVVSGGVRRSSLISLSDLDSKELQSAKNWPFPLHRYMSNNSAVYHEKPSSVDFLREWTNLAESGSGERGIFNLGAAKASVSLGRDPEQIAGVNPCGEIMLRSKEFCNLSTVLVKPDDDQEKLIKKARLASWIGTIQASFTDFKYLRKEWKENCDEEALLGVSISGQMDNPELLTADLLQAMKREAIKTNIEAAKILGINPSKSITCGKPEGTSSQLAFSGSGCHPWYARHYIRRVRISSTDPLFHLMRDSGVKCTPEVGQTETNATTWVIDFPCKAPDTAVVRDTVSAMDQLKWYRHIQTNWCTHNQSITVYVKDSEWLEVGNWVYNNWDIINGVSFLPYDGGKYQLAPYEEISEDQYNRLIRDMPKVDFSALSLYEQSDLTEGAKSLACVSGACDIT
jgi:ribonucleoside-diphosphate reductase alpha chain